LTDEVPFDIPDSWEWVRLIDVCEYMVVFCVDDGSEIVKRWTDRSRAESWTPEMKEKARQRALQARRHKV